MTREEIRERAETFARIFFGAPVPMEVLEIEGYSIALVRATLEEAARAVCPGCSGTGRIADHSSPCYAIKIYDLIAKLDKEGEGE